MAEPTDTLSSDELDAFREGWAFEAKLARGRDGQGELPLSFWPSYAAMANTEGGRIVLGLREKPDGGLVVEGIPDVDKVERDLWATLDNRSKVSANVLARHDVERRTFEGRLLLVINVPKASRAQRPVFLNGSWETGTYLRVHEGDRVADRDVARRMLADANPTHDATILDGYASSDFSSETIRKYRQMFSAHKPDHPFLAESESGFLQQIRALGRDRVRGAEGVTRAGLLMFGRESAIRDLFPHWHLSYREQRTVDEPERRWDDRIAPDGTWEANVFEFYLRVIGPLLRGLKVPFALSEGQFRITETPAHRAVREAFINTLVHADYQGPGGLRVIRDDTGFHFINPGLLLVSPEQVWRGGVSESRNPTLQHLFSLLSLGEREGSGGPAIQQAWAQQHWQRPGLREDVEHSETHLELRQVSLLPAESVQALQAALGERFAALDERGRLALVTAHAEGDFDHPRLNALTGAHSRDVTLGLQALMRRGLLELKGRRYRLPAWLAQATGAAKVPSDTPTPPAGPGATGATDATDATTATPSQATGPRRAAVEQAILLACEGQYLSRDELARRVGRSAATLRNSYLPSLVSAGRLELRFPDNPNHPEQAYRTAVGR